MRLLLAVVLIVAVATNANAYVRVISWDLSPVQTIDYKTVAIDPANDLAFTTLHDRVAGVVREVHDLQPDLITLYNVIRFTEIFEGIETPVELVAMDAQAMILGQLADRSLDYSAISVVELNEAFGEADSILHAGERAGVRVEWSNVVLVKTSEIGKVGLSEEEAHLFQDTSSYVIESEVEDEEDVVVSVFNAYQRVPFTKEGKTWVITSARLDTDSDVNGAQLAELLTATSGDAHSILVGSLSGVVGAVDDADGDAWYKSIINADYADVAFFQRNHEQRTCCFDLTNTASALTSRQDFAFVRSTDGGFIDCAFDILGDDVWAGSTRIASHAGVYASISAPHRGPLPHEARPVEPPQLFVMTYEPVPSSSYILNGDDDESDTESNPLVTPTTPGDDGDGTFFATGPLSPTTPEDEEDRVVSPTTPLRTDSGDFVPFSVSDASTLSFSALVVAVALLTLSSFML